MHKIRIGENFPYRYNDPRDFGYLPTLITGRQLKKLGVGSGRGNLLIRADVFWNPEQGFHIEYLPSFLAKALLTVVLPFAVLILGVWNLPEHMRDYRRTIFPRKYGAFSTDDIALNSKLTPALQALL